MKLVLGLVQKGVVGDALLLGIAEHDYTSGAAVTAKDRVIVAEGNSDTEFRGELKTATGAATQALTGTAIGWLSEGGYAKLDTAAVVKPFTVMQIVEAGDGANQVRFRLNQAARQLQ